MLHGELWIAGQHNVLRMAAVVDRLETVDQRSALDRHAADVGCYVWIGLDAFDRHRQGEFEQVARLPLLPYQRIALVHDGSNGLSVEGDFRAVAPGGDSQGDRKPARSVRVHRQPHSPIPRIASLLRKRDGVVAERNCRGSGDVQIHVDAILAAGVDVARQRRQKPRDVRRAAGTIEKRLAMVFSVAR